MRPRKRSVTGSRPRIRGTDHRPGDEPGEQDSGEDLDNLYEEFRRNKSVDL